MDEEIKGEVSDELSVILEKKDNTKKYDDEIARFEKDKKKRLKKERLTSLWQNALKIVDPDYYATIVQKFENLLFVLFVDIILVIILFSSLYALYIIFMFDDNSNLNASIFKVAGALLIDIVGIVIQVNLNQDKSKTGE